MPSSTIIADQDWDVWTMHSEEDKTVNNYCTKTGLSRPVSSESSQPTRSFIGEVDDHQPHMRFADRSGYLPARIHQDIVPFQLTEFAKLEPNAWNQDEVAAAIDMMVAFLKAEDMEFPFLTPEEAWNGFSVNGERVMEPMPMDTSPGIGFAELLPKGRRTKRDLMDANPKFVLDMLEEDWNALGSTAPLLFFIKENPKIELRDAPRVFAKKTRLYDAGPLPYTYMTRRLLGRFLAKMYQKAKTLRFFQCAGMDVFRGKWNEFVRHLTNCFEGQLGAFDISKFDKAMSFNFMWIYAQVLTALCTEEEKWRIHRHESRMMFSPIYIALLGLLYQPTCMNHSGRADTVIFNGFVNLFVMFIAWVRNTPRSMWTFTAFFAHIQPRVVGDDNVANYALKSPLTFEMVLETYNRFGWSTTLEGEPGGPENVSFAGRRFVWIPFANQWWPVLPRGRILAIQEWIKKGRTEVQRLERWSAGAMYSFPLMFMEHNGRADPAFHVIWEGFLDKHRRFARLTGKPKFSCSLAEMYGLYTGHRISEAVILSYYQRYVNTYRNQES